MDMRNGGIKAVEVNLHARKLTNKTLNSIGRHAHIADCSLLVEFWVTRTGSYKKIKLRLKLHLATPTFLTRNQILKFGRCKIKRHYALNFPG